MRKPLWVVVLGASAGGLEALQPAVAELKPSDHVAYVVVQHLSPQHSSLLGQLLQRVCALPVSEIVDGDAIAPGAVYIAPPKYDVNLDEGCFRLVPPQKSPGPSPSIDVFLESLAESHGSNSVAVILSGTGSDGSHGVRAIKEVGGFVLAQTKASAKYDGMPRAAAATGAVDFEVEPKDIAARVAGIVSHAGQVIATSPGEGESDHVQDIIGVAREASGIDFSGYKRSTLVRRIQARMTSLQTDSLEEYVDLLRGDPEEAQRLVQSTLISVTGFFRDSAAFEALQPLVSKLSAEATREKKIRVWVPGCATGEEAYSIAILFAEEMERADRSFDFQIFGSDVDEQATVAARRAIYTPAAVRDLRPEYLKRYFRTNQDSYQVVKSVRDRVVFARHNLLEDPPFLHVALVSCRNLLIYFAPANQQEALNLFHRALIPGGYLFLGKSETTAQAPGLFREIDRACRLYQRKAAIARYRPSAAIKQATMKPVAKVVEEARPRVQDVAASTLLESFGPASAVIDSDLHLIHTMGPIESFLNVRKGSYDGKILNFLEDELRITLATLVRKQRGGEARVSMRIRARGEEGETRLIRLTVMGLPPIADDTLLLVVFEEMPIAAKAPSRPSGEDDDESRGEFLSIVDLEHELTATREHLQTVIEELETSNEELQSANEELQASNEELQATNEELETANEELQSTNEELITVNEELEVRSAELNAAITDISNIQESVGFAILVVDTSLKITRFNHVAQELFQLDEQFMNAAIERVLEPMHVDRVRGRIERAIRRRKSTTIQTRTEDAVWQLRITPCVDDKDAVVGAVLVWIDVTEETRARLRLEESEERFRQISESSGEYIWELDSGGRYQFASVRVRDVLGVEPEQVLGRRPEEFAIDEDVERVREFMDALAKSNESFNDFEYRLKTSAGSVRWVRMNGMVARGKGGRVRGYRGTTLDITDRIVAQLEAAERENSYRDMVSKVPGVIFQWYEPRSGEGRFHYVSPNVEDVFGISSTEFLENPEGLRLKARNGESWGELVTGCEAGNGGSPCAASIVRNGGPEERVWIVTSRIDEQEAGTLFNGLIIASRGDGSTDPLAGAEGP